MILEYGNIWCMWGKTSLLCITTNSTLRNGSLVMGAGIAAEANKMVLGLDSYLGQEIIKHRSQAGIYGLVTVEVVTRLGGQNVGAFQTKIHPSDDSTLGLISVSLQKLFGWILHKEIETGYQPIRIDLNFPGIGLGKLRKEDVLPLLNMLPDCVHVWQPRLEQPARQLSFADLKVSGHEAPG